ncbi:hypothetical protein TVAG_483980 [Trichomonas vaginalis G3]|uniref:Uncharacterized protein n=1 Tax=Trichomonas vaginalis (strain ATCC PRA-98 / G3) TaxID=412133 RepID=A2EA41_TRIV3|nr:hypothetical protein TVAGG3_0980860 [Trichomonas vaginalis G3]EAY10487.1 hypothetical protein TVAG_483980 [Trichomonas vaginalis G3]KAI5489285.1 hypothetical protein TVAGG3_0980860 [Trichomonas vaginalis G3]|eukprot:XP_001322710.1 hypothetical protein [Trichomonas vaginalis G3]
MNKEAELNYSFLTDEPYTSELYSSLLEPALNQVKESYTLAHKRPLTQKQILKIIVSSAAQGALIGFLTASTKVAIRNMTHDYESQEKKGPKDLYFLQYYTNPKKYPSMLRGLKSQLKVEISYKTCQKSLNALSKIMINPSNLEFHQSLGFNLVRTFTCNLLTASTVYPLSLYMYTNTSAEEIMRKTLRRAGPGSFFSSLTSLGLSIVKSLMPSQKDTISVLMDIIS